MPVWHGRAATAAYLTAAAYSLGRSPAHSNDDYLLVLAPLVALWAACATVLCTRLPDQLAPLALALGMGGLGAALATAATWDPALYGAVLLGVSPCLAGTLGSGGDGSLAPAAAALALLLRAAAGPPTTPSDASTVAAAAIGALAACLVVQAVPTGGIGATIGQSRVPLLDTWAMFVLSALPGTLGAGSAIAAFSADDASFEVHWAAPAAAVLVSCLALCRCTAALRPLAVLFLCATARTVLAVAGHTDTLRIGDALLQPLALHAATRISQASVHRTLATCVEAGGRPDAPKRSRAALLASASVFDASLAAAITALAVACLCIGRATGGSLLPGLVVGLALSTE